VRRAAASLVLALATVAPQAAADSTSDCIAASEAAQSLRDRRALLAARDKLAVCSRDVCPGPIRSDCIEQRGEVDSAMPSVVLRAKDALAEDLVDVKVLCDGVVLATQVDGKALAVDPGAHTFRFEARGLPPVERKLVIGEGEKNRLVVAELVSEAPVVPVPTPAETPAEPPEGGSHLWIPGLVVGAVGVAATIPMAVLWLSSTSDVRQMKDTCAPSAGGAGCSADRVDSDRTKLVVGDFFLGVAAAGIAGGALLLFTHRGAACKEHGAPPPVHLDASPIRDGGFLSAAGVF
jgi:hypothetical protein